MKPLTIKCSRIAALTLIVWSANTLAASSPIIPPGVPEPGLVLWGTVVNATNTTQQIPIASVSWAVTDGVETGIYAATTRPPTRIVPFEGVFYYVLEVPFDTRTLGARSLTNPATIGIQSFELRSSTPPTYSLVATINGSLASVHALDSSPASGTNMIVANFDAAARGRVIRVDLAMVPQAMPYDLWAAAIWGSATHPDALRSADPDGDGLNNEGEYQAGTDPRDPNSTLRILTLAIGADAAEVTLDWLSVANRRYQIESAAQIEGPWTEVGALVPSGGPTTQASLTGEPAAPGTYYRVRVVP